MKPDPNCEECGGTGVEHLLAANVLCGVCMPSSPDDTDKTPPQTPAAKRSSGELRLNLDGALCGREGCQHRRDHHTTVAGGSHRWHCLDCRCPEFVAGGPVDEFAALADSSKPPPPTEKT